MTSRTVTRAVSTRPLRGRPGAAALVSALLLLAGQTAPAAAQRWTVDAQVGQLRFQGAPGDFPATSVVLGGGYDDATSWLRLSGGVPTGGQEPLWAAAGLGKRLEAAAGPLRLGLDLAGNGFLQHDRSTPAQQSTGGGLFGPLDPAAAPTPDRSGYGLAGQGAAFVAALAGPARLELRGGGSAYHSSVGGAQRERTLPLAEARLVLAPQPALAFSAAARRYFARDGAATLAEASATLASPRAAVWGSLGHWLAAPAGVVRGTPWGAGASLRVLAPAELTLEARHDAYDPLYLSIPRTSWSAGVRLTLARPRAPAPPVPAAYAAGRATIALPAKDAAGAPSVAGDFNGWHPQPMERAGDDWRLSVPLSPGVYYYAFVAPDGHWYVPASVAGRRDDGMGGQVAVLVVK